MSDNKRSRQERQLAQTVNDPKRVAREKAARQKERDAKRGNGQPKEK